MDTLDLWTKDHCKDKSYFEEIFYSLLENGFELSDEIYLYYGQDSGVDIAHQSRPTNGYKPAYRLTFRKIDERDTYKISELDEISKLLVFVKSCCRRLQADLGPTYVDFKCNSLEVDVIHEDMVEVINVNEDLISFQGSIHRAVDIHNSSIRKESLNLRNTETGVIMEVGHLSKGQMVTLNKHIDKLKWDWQGWYNAEYRWKYSFNKNIERKTKKMVLTYIKTEKLQRNR